MCDCPCDRCNAKTLVEPVFMDFNGEQIRSNLCEVCQEDYAIYITPLTQIKKPKKTTRVLKSK